MNGFVKISKYAGMREDIVQAGGGNSSFKVASDKMVIKASGYQLSDITVEDGYALVNPEIIRDAFLDTDLDKLNDATAKRILDEAYIEGKRPSIETFLHAISGKYTLHTHPIVVNAITCRKNGEIILKELFPKTLIVPYATPGVDLAKAYFRAYKEAVTDDKQTFDVVFLMNHGVVIAGDSADEVIEKTEEVLYKLEKYLEIDYSEYHDLTKIWKYFSGKIVWKITDVNVLNAYENIGEWEHTFCPDCIVFLGKKMLILPEEYDETIINKFIKNYGEPVMLSYNGSMYIVADSVKKAMEIQSVMSFSAQVMVLNKDAESVLLSDSEQNFLLDWDVEKYRKQIK